MTKRPAGHVLADQAVSRISSIFTDIGWTCEPISKDYGEDLSVRIFTRGKATPKHFFVQCKGTEHARFTRQGTLRHAFGRPLLRLWQDFRQLVVVAIFDATTQKIYWQPAQEYLNSLNPPQRGDAQSILFWRDRVLDTATRKSIEILVDEYHARGDGGSAGSRYLVELLKEKYGLDVMIDTTGFFVLPKGRFIEDRRSRSHDGYAFGSMANLVTAAEKEGGASFEILLHEALESRKKREARFRRTGRIREDGFNFTSKARYDEYQAAKSGSPLIGAVTRAQSKQR